MRVIALATIRDFWAIHPDAEQPLRAWYLEAKSAEWENPAQLKSQYKTASVLKNGRVVFNIAGNKYRLVAAISYKHQVIFIKFAGTHKDYDRIDAQNIEFGE